MNEIIRDVKPEDAEHFRKGYSFPHSIGFAMSK